MSGPRSATCVGRWPWTPVTSRHCDGLAQVLRDIGEKRAALQVMRRLVEVHPYWEGTEQAIEELSREVEGQGI